MKNTTIILVFFVLVLGYLLLFVNKNENFITSQENAEAIANVASLYNTGNLTVSNMNVSQNLTAINSTATNMSVTGSFNLLPKGVIVAWNGTTAPAGWALCNGQNGTPDLRNRFITGSGGEYALGATGGADTVTLSVAQIPSHNHISVTGINWGDGILGNGSGAFSGGGGAQFGTDGSAFYTSYTGSGQAHENRPPYYALAFIMKL